MQDTERITQVINVANQKGGVGKTTNSINLAAALGELGRKVLVIDLDSTGGATKTFSVPLVGWQTIYDVLAGEVEPLEAVITDQDDEIKLPQNVHLIPAGPHLKKIDSFLNDPENLGVVSQDVLLEPIKTLRGKYDYIFFDSPPQVTKYTFPAYKAADYAVLVTHLERLSYEGLQGEMKLIDAAKQHGNEALELLGVVVSLVPKPLTRLGSYYKEKIEETFTNEETGECLLLEPMIKRSVVVQEATQARKPLTTYAPRHAVTEQYRGLVLALEARLEKIDFAKGQVDKEVANG